MITQNNTQDNKNPRLVRFHNGHLYRCHRNDPTIVNPKRNDGIFGMRLKTRMIRSIEFTRVYKITASVPSGVTMIKEYIAAIRLEVMSTLSDNDKAEVTVTTSPRKVPKSDYIHTDVVDDKIVETPWKKVSAKVEITYTTVADGRIIELELGSDSVPALGFEVISCEAYPDVEDSIVDCPLNYQLA